jgi:hypothetical protein
LGQLFKNPARLYVYPHQDLEAGTLVTAESYPVAPHLKHLYAYLLENRYIQGVRKFDPELARIRRREVITGLQSGTNGWEQMVPPQIVEIIKREGLFGYRARG